MNGDNRRPKKDVDVAQANEMRGNSDFWREMFTRYTNRMFLKQAQYYLDNCSPRDDYTYDTSVVTTVLPEAMKRIDEQDKIIRMFIDHANDLGGPKENRLLNIGRARS